MASTAVEQSVQTTIGEGELTKLEKFKTDFFREMKEVWEDKRGYDVTLVIGDKKFQCHRLILSMSSSYFKKLFYGNFKEKNNKEITLLDLESKSFEDILNAIYSGEIDLHAGNLYQILKTSSFLNITAIEEACVSHIMTGNHVHYLIEVCLFADLIGKRELFTECVKRIGTDLLHFSRVEMFTSLPFDVFNLVLQQAGKNSNNDENIIILAIIQWTKFNQVEAKVIKILLDAAKLTKISPTIMSNMILALDRNFCEDDQTRKKLKLSNEQCNDNEAPSLNAYVSAINVKTGAKGMAVFKLVRREIFWILDSFDLFSYDSILKVVTVENARYILTYEEKFNCNKIYLMDNTSGKLKGLTNLTPVVLKNFHAVADGTNIYVFGIEPQYQSVFVYDSITDSWSPIPMPLRLTKKFTVAVLDSKIYILSMKITSFNCKDSSFSTLADIPFAYDYAAACAINGKVYFCGFTVENEKIRNEFVAFDVTTLKFDSLKRLNNDRATLFRLVYYDGFLYALDHQPFECLERYNIDLNNWFSMASIPLQSSYRDQVVSTGQFLDAEVAVN